jgi:glucuronokinase
LSRLVDENFDVRRAIFTLPGWQVQMVDAARACGASANFAGSGGAIVGTYDDERTFERLQDALLAVSSRVIKPQIVDRS